MRDGDEPRRVGGERHSAGQQQTAEARPRGVQACGAIGHLRADRTHHLDAVAHPDSKDEERHQDRHRIDAETQPSEPAELPDHGDEGASERRRSQPDRPRVGVNEQGGDEECQSEECHDPDGAVGDVADHLRKPYDVQIDVNIHVCVCAGLAADALKLVCNLDVVEPLAAVRMELLKLGGDDGAGEVVRHQATDDAGLDDVLPHPGKAGLGRLEVRRKDVAGGDAVLHHLDVAHVRRQDGEDLSPVDTGKEEHLVGHLAQRGEETGREHVAVPRHDRDQHPIRAAELLAVLEEGLHVLVLDRHQLGETGVDSQTRREPPHCQGGQHEYRQHEGSPGEEQSFDVSSHTGSPGVSPRDAGRRTHRSAARRRPRAAAQPISPRAGEALRLTHCDPRRG